MTNDIQKAYQNIDNAPSKPFTNEQIRELLVNYDNNRKAVETILINLQSEANGELYPSSTDLEDERVQKSLDTWSIIEDLLRKCENYRNYYKKTLERLREITMTLDKLVYCITRIRPNYQTVIVKAYFDGKEDYEIAEELQLSESSIQKTRNKGIAALTDRMNM